MTTQAYAVCCLIICSRTISAFSVAAGQQETTRLLATQRFDLMLLDLRLGQEDGLDLLRSLRAQSDLPVIIATGHRRDEIDRVVGAGTGRGRLHPQAVRSARAAGAHSAWCCGAWSPPGARRGASGKQGLVRFAQWTLNRRTRRLAGPDGSPVALTKGEYAPADGVFSIRRSRSSAGSSFCKRPGCTRTSWIAASTCRSCGCAASWKWTRARQGSFERSVVSAISLT
ncbi:MAG: response regulator [Acetobacteraceae bacterium]